ncbi:MAG: hypothetical protein OEX97_03260 [Acidimicrobiia bacterium]|nr:hypothetical protein [Acidimicrobiia bacterium]
MTQTTDEQRLSRLQKTGRWLILFGVSVWIVWFVVKALGGHPKLGGFLPFHLIGVIPGSIMSRWGSVRKLFRRASNPD